MRAPRLALATALLCAGTAFGAWFDGVKQPEPINESDPHFVAWNGTNTTASSADVAVVSAKVDALSNYTDNAVADLYPRSNPSNYVDGTVTNNVVFEDKDSAITANVQLTGNVKELRIGDDNGNSAVSIRMKHQTGGGIPTLSQVMIWENQTETNTLSMLNGWLNYSTPGSAKGIKADDFDGSLSSAQDYPIYVIGTNLTATVVQTATGTLVYVSYDTNGIATETYADNAAAAASNGVITRIGGSNYATETYVDTGDAAVSNNVVTMYTAADSTLSNNVVTLYSAADTSLSNNIVTLYAAADGVLSNNLVTLYSTADGVVSNNLVALLYPRSNPSNYVDLTITNQCATTGYVDAADALLLPLDGSRALTADANAGNHNWTNLAGLKGSGSLYVLGKDESKAAGIAGGGSTGLANGASVITYPTNWVVAAQKGNVIARPATSLPDTYFAVFDGNTIRFAVRRADGRVTLYGDQNMGGNIITNYGTPTAAGHVVDMGWVQGEGYATITQVNDVSNNVTTAYKAADSTLSNNVVTLFQAADATTSNGVISRIGGSNFATEVYVDAVDLQTVVNVGQSATNIGRLTLDSKLADHQASGLSFFSAVGETVAFPNVLYCKNDAEFYKADASTNTMVPVSVMALQSKTNGQTCELFYSGLVRDDSWSWTKGGILYLSETAGAMTQIMPTGTYRQVQKMGHAINTNTIFFHPDLTVIERQ